MPVVNKHSVLLASCRVRGSEFRHTLALDFGVRIDSLVGVLNMRGFGVGRLVVMLILHSHLQEPVLPYSEPVLPS